MILTIDLGTTLVKFALFDREGRLVALHRAKLPTIRRQPGHREVSIEGLERLWADGIRQLGSMSGGLQTVEAVSFSTQANSFALFDKQSRALTPMILWNDERAAGFGEEIGRSCHWPAHAAATGLSRLSLQCLPPKFLWLRKYQPERVAATRRLLTIGDYLVEWLTGRAVAEAGATGLTGLLNIHSLEWMSEILHDFGIRPEWLARVKRAGSDLGRIHSRIATLVGLPLDCRVVLGCLDQYAGAVGCGVGEPGAVVETTGTVMTTVELSNDFAVNLDPEVIQGPSMLPGLYYRMAVSQLGASSLQAWREYCAATMQTDELAELAARVKPGAEGLKLRGEGVIGDPARTFEGWTDHHTPAHGARCIMESVALELNRHLSMLHACRLDTIRAAGGGARSSAWLQIKADVLGILMTPSVCPEPASLGAAILAEAFLRDEAVADVARQWVRLEAPLHPDPICHQYYLRQGISPSGAREVKA